VIGDDLVCAELSFFSLSGMFPFLSLLVPNESERRGGDGGADNYLFSFFSPFF